jgi:NAD-dependent DNA ligase
MVDERTKRLLSARWSDWRLARWATREQLESVPGIGAVRADRIEGWAHGLWAADQ